jgi:hypothetical protein
MDSSQTNLFVPVSHYIKLAIVTAAKILQARHGNHGLESIPRGEGGQGEGVSVCHDV